MASARPLVSVFAPEDASSASGQSPLPTVFSAPIRPDVVQFVHTNMAKNKRQPYAVSRRAGHQTSAESWGTGRAVSRIPRVQGGGTQRSGQAAFGNMCRGGRMFAPTKVWRKWTVKTNVNQKRYAVASALAASALPSLVMARGHKIDQVPELPLVVGGDVESIKKTSKTMELFTRFGVSTDLDRVETSRKLRAGKGKMRNRRFVMRRGPLVVYDAAEGLELAVRNIPGVEACQVDRLNLLQLAPGGHMGRFIVWTKGAFEKLDSIYGTYAAGSSNKKNYTLPRSQMTNADLARIINSDEVQSACRPAKEAKAKAESKKNPLKNLDALVKLNPYAEIHRASEKRAQTARAEAKAKEIEARRKGSYKVPAAVKAQRAEKKARKTESKARFAEMARERPVEESDEEEEEEEEEA